MWPLHNLKECMNHPDEWHAFIIGMGMCSPKRFLTNTAFADLWHEKHYFYAGRLAFFAAAAFWITLLVFVVTCIVSGV